jgi:ribonucleoside-diphosphate reductase alpha chain
LGLKGCTTFRPNPVTGAVLEDAGMAHCCAVEPEYEAT